MLQNINEQDLFISNPREAMQELFYVNSVINSLRKVGAY